MYYKVKVLSQYHSLREEGQLRKENDNVYGIYLTQMANTTKKSCRYIRKFIITKHFHKHICLTSRHLFQMSLYLNKMMDTKTSIQAWLQDKKIPLWIFFGNIPLHWRQPQVRHFFQDYGKILQVKMIKKYSNYVGIANVKFESMTCANFAIQKFNDKYNEQYKKTFTLRWLYTEQSRLGITQNGDHKLFIGSLPRQAKQQDLYDLFSQLGQVEKVHLQEKQFWAFVDYKYKQSALLAIKHFNGQTYFHGSHIPIDVRFKEKKYNSFMQKKHEKEDIDPFLAFGDHFYYEAMTDKQMLYFHLKTKIYSRQQPPIGSCIRKLDGTGWYEIRCQQQPALNMQLMTKKFGPVGSNLFLFHLPNDAHELQIYNLFRKFGNILSVRIMKEKSGKSKGIGFVSFDSPQSARIAIDQMNSFEVRGKRLKVELNKKDEEILGKVPTQLQLYQIV